MTTAVLEVLPRFNPLSVDDLVALWPRFGLQIWVSAYLTGDYACLHGAQWLALGGDERSLLALYRPPTTGNPIHGALAERYASEYGFVRPPAFYQGEEHAFNKKGRALPPPRGLLMRLGFLEQSVYAEGYRIGAEVARRVFGAQS